MILTYRLLIVTLRDKTVGRGEKRQSVLGESKIICGFSMEWGSVPLTPTFKGQLYSEFLLTCKNILTCENVEEKVSVPHVLSSHSYACLKSN